MDLGAHLPNQGPLATREAVTTFCREAEKAGIASLWVSDHVIFPRTAGAATRADASRIRPTGHISSR